MKLEPATTRLVGAAAVLAVGILGATVAAIWFSPYQSCVRVIEAGRPTTWPENTWTQDQIDAQAQTYCATGR